MDAGKNTGLPVEFNDIVDEIVEFTGDAKSQVQHRLWMEAIQPSWNVWLDVERLGVEPHVFNEAMARLYTDSDGFIYETLAFWAVPARQRWIEQALTRIRLHLHSRGIGAESARVLVLGDGSGNDSIYLSNDGLLVDYFDVPGSRTFAFATRRFERYAKHNAPVQVIEEYEHIIGRHYELVLSFEVLEHLPDPIGSIRDMAHVLNRGGIALVTESFKEVGQRHPTHLYANVQFTSWTPLLFHLNNMPMTWHSTVDRFKPMEFTKMGGVSWRQATALLKDRDLAAEFGWARARDVVRLVRGAFLSPRGFSSVRPPERRRPRPSR